MRTVLLTVIVSAIVTAATGVAAAEDHSFSVWAVDDMVKINPETGKAFEQKENFYKTANTDNLRATNWIWDGKTVSLEGARNETVGWQIIIEPSEGKTLHDVSCSAGNLKGPGAEIEAKNVIFYRAWYIPATKATFDASLGTGFYPDALVPFSFGSEKRGAPFDFPSSKNPVPKQKNQSIFVDLYIPAATKPGNYTGSITIKAQEGQVELPLKLTVYPFAMPNENSFHYWGFSYSEIDNKKDQNVRLEYYRIAQAHRFFIGVISSGIKPKFNLAGGTMDFADYDEKVAPLLDGTAFKPEDGYGPAPGMNTPVTDYCTPIAWDPTRIKANNRRSGFWPMSEAETSTPSGDTKLISALQTYYKHLDEKGWTKKTRHLIFINGLDEPRGKADLEKICHYGDWLAQAKTPFYYGIAINGVSDVLARCATTPADFLTRTAKMGNIDWISTANGGICSKLFAEDMKSNPHHICNFDGCREPMDGSPHTDCEQLGLRINPWLSRKFSPLFNGYVLWSVDLNDEKVWNDADNYDGKINGMAFLIYPAEATKNGVGLPVPSIRCKALRRGLQDYEMMHALDQSGQGAAVQEIVEGLIQSGWDVSGTGKFETNPKYGQWNHNPKAWYEARHKLLEKLSAQ